MKKTYTKPQTEAINICTESAILDLSFESTSEKATNVQLSEKKGWLENNKSSIWN